MGWNEKRVSGERRVLYISTDILYDGKEQTGAHALQKNRSIKSQKGTGQWHRIQL